MVIIEIQKAKSRQIDLERLLGLFDQSQTDSADVHRLSIIDEDYPENFQSVICRLMKAISEPAVRDIMQVEDEYLGKLENLERAIACHEDIIARKNDIIAEQNSVLYKNQSA